MGNCCFSKAHEELKSEQIGIAQTRFKTDGNPTPKLTRKSVGGYAPEESRAEIVSGSFSLRTEFFKDLGHRMSKKDVASTEPQRVERQLLPETRRESSNRRKWTSSDSPARPPAMSSSKVYGDDHIPYDITPGRRSVERQSEERKSAARKSFDRKSLDRKSLERKLGERKEVERTITDAMRKKDRCSSDRKGGVSQDQDSKSLKENRLRNGYVTQSGSILANPKFVPECGHSLPLDIDFWAQLFLVNNCKETSRPIVYGDSSVLSNPPRDSLSAQEIDEIRTSYRKSASKAAARDLNAFKSITSIESNELSKSTSTTD